jgi:hypothetical protein
MGREAPSDTGRVAELADAELFARERRQLAWKAVVRANDRGAERQAERAPVEIRGCDRVRGSYASSAWPS